MRAPVEEIVKDALKALSFQTELKQKIIEELKPVLVAAAKTAAADALKEVQVAVDPVVQQQMRTNAANALSAAFTEAAKAAFAGVDKLAAETSAKLQTKLQTQIEKAVKEGTADPTKNLDRNWTNPIAQAVRSAIATELARVDALKVPERRPPEVTRGADVTGGADGTDAADSKVGADARGGPAPRPPSSFSIRDNLMDSWPVIQAVGAAILIVGFAFYLFWATMLRPWFNTGDQADNNLGDGGANETISSDTTRTELLVTSLPALATNYRNAVTTNSSATVPMAPEEQLKCVDEAIAKASDGKILNMLALRSSLSGCTALSPQPSEASSSSVVAVVQAQLKEEAAGEKCEALKKESAMKVDGLVAPGGATARAMKAYVDCHFDPAKAVPVPDKLDRLSDYAAVGVFFIHKRSLGQ
ncbi:MAG: hypothetical protein M3P06_03030 [Acidobacteriota bacterium]|nr:hypothetical protein [Acidobacteriota bacterium]